MAVTRINVARSRLQNSFHTAWVTSGPRAGPPRRSAPGGQADEIGGKADVAAQTSAVGGRADLPRPKPEQLLLARSGPEPTDYPSTVTATE